MCLYCGPDGQPPRGVWLCSGIPLRGGPRVQPPARKQVSVPISPVPCICGQAGRTRGTTGEIFTSPQNASIDGGM